MNSGKIRTVQTDKTNYMRADALADLKEAMEDGLAFERGERRNLKVTRIQAPRPPKAMFSPLLNFNQLQKHTLTGKGK